MKKLLVFSYLLLSSPCFANLEEVPKVGAITEKEALQPQEQEAKKHRLWVSPSISDAVDRVVPTGKTKHKLYDASVGYGYQLRDDLQVGLFYSYGFLRTRLVGSINRSESQNHVVSPFLVYKIRNSVFFNLSASAGRKDIKFKAGGTHADTHANLTAVRGSFFVPVLLERVLLSFEVGGGYLNNDMRATKTNLGGSVAENGLHFGEYFGKFRLGYVFPTKTIIYGKIGHDRRLQTVKEERNGALYTRESFGSQFGLGIQHDVEPYTVGATYTHTRGFDIIANTYALKFSVRY